MEPFSISCTTCKSRLKVKSQAAVGHLLTCPKCGGKVLVKLPEEAKPGESASLRAETAPAIQKPIRPADAQDTLGQNQDFDEVDELLASGVPKGLPPAAKSVGATKTVGPSKTVGPTKTVVKEKTSRFAEGEPASAAHGVGAGSNGKVDQVAQKEPAPPVPGSEVLLLPSGDWSSQRPWKSWLFLAVSILVGMGLAFVVVALSLSFFQDETNTALNPDQNPGEEQPAETMPDTSPSATESSAKKIEDPAKNSTSEETSAKASAPADQGTTQETKSPSTAVTEEDPLGLSKKPPAETKSKPSSPANDPFSKFDRLTEDTGDPTAPAPDPAATVSAVPKPAEGTPETPSKPALPRPPARTINLTARQNDLLPGLTIAANEVKLADFLQSMQDFSTIPITLEPDNLAIFKLSADSAVPKFAGENLKFGAALAAVLAKMNLEVAVEDEQIIIRKPELTRELKLMQVAYDVQALVQDEKQAVELAERITALIEPGSWGDDDDETTCSLTPGTEKFAVRHRLSAQVQILTLTEKLRVARGLPPSRTDYAPDTFVLATRTEKAAAQLALPVSLTFNRPTPLVKICQKLSAAGKVHILIDWRSIAAAGWNPDAELTLVVDKKPLSEALGALVEPMDLAYRVVDGRTIQIVSPQYLAEHLELELHPVKDVVSGPEQIEPLLARVRASLAEGAGESPGQVWLDEPSKTLVAMLPQPKQQLLTRLLAEWRTKETK